MNYDQLKDLSPRELMELIERTARACKDMPLIPGFDYHSREVNAPLLCMIGDFEIRARFTASYDPFPTPAACHTDP